jgi:hypothetical protein
VPATLKLRIPPSPALPRKGGGSTRQCPPYVTALLAPSLQSVYHSDHRELCAHEHDWPFRIVNILEVVGASMGSHQEDRFKQLKIMQDADAIVAECRDLMIRHALDPETARNVVVKAMLGDQPLPLMGRDRAPGAPCEASPPGEPVQPS